MSKEQKGLKRLMNREGEKNVERQKLIVLDRKKM